MLLAGLYLLLQFITLFYQRPFSHSLYIFSTLQYTKAGDTLRIVPGDWRFHLCAHFMNQGLFPDAATALLLLRPRPVSTLTGMILCICVSHSRV